MLMRVYIILFNLYCFFFFQAEDGIRDGHVTGVQTCALPISDRERAARLHRDLPELDRADLVEDLLDEVVQADGHAARRHDDVAGRPRVGEARAERVAEVGDDAGVHDLAAALLDGPAEREPVRVVDMTWRGRLTRLDPLVPRPRAADT